MPRLIAAVLRHAEYQQRPDTPSAHQPYPLTKEGRKQAARAALALQKMAADHDLQIVKQIHCSLLLRAWETANIIGEQLDGCYSVTAFAELAERSMGSAANLTVDEVQTIIENDPRYPTLPSDWKSNSQFCLPLQGAESLVQAGSRVANHLCLSMNHLSQQLNRDALMIFVGHGAAIRHAAYILGILEFEQIARLSMYHAEPVYFEMQRHSWKHIAGHWKQRDRVVELD